WLNPAAQLSDATAATVVTGEPMAVRVPPMAPPSSVAVPALSLQATTVHCAPDFTASWSLKALSELAASRCLFLSLHGDMSPTGATICTPGVDVAQAICWMVLLVELPAPSFSVTVRLIGVLLVQATLMQVSVSTAVTATEPLVGSGEAVPTATDRFLTASAPSEAGRPAASPELVLAHTLNAPPVSSLGPKNLPSAGDEMVRTGGVESTVNMALVEWPTRAALLV